MWWPWTLVSHFKSYEENILKKNTVISGNKNAKIQVVVEIEEALCLLAEQGQVIVIITIDMILKEDIRPKDTMTMEEMMIGDIMTEEGKLDKYNNIFLKDQDQMKTEVVTDISTLTPEEVDLDPHRETTSSKKEVIDLPEGISEKTGKTETFLTEVLIEEHQMKIDKENFIEVHQMICHHVNLAPVRVTKKEDNLNLILLEKENHTEGMLLLEVVTEVMTIEKEDQCNTTEITETEEISIQEIKRKREALEKVFASFAKLRDIWQNPVLKITNLVVEEDLMKDSQLNLKIEYI